MESAPQPAARRDLPRVVGFLGASGVMIGVMIGSGIFRTPPEIAVHLANPMIILGAWVIGGLVALAGAMSFAELATMFPQSGGVYVFLREGYGRAPAFIFGWMYLIVTKPAGAAGIAFACAEAVNILLGTDFDLRIITSVILVVLTVLNIVGVRSSTAIGVALTSLKVAALLAIIVLGTLHGLGMLHAGSVPLAWPRAGPPIESIWLAIVPVMAGVMWTYDGWSDVGAIAGEIREPQRTLPRVLVVNTIGVTALYVGVNAVYLWLVPLDELRTMKDSLAQHVLGLLLGNVGAVCVTVLVIVSTFGSSHASVMTGARVSFAQARDGLLFNFLGRVDPRFQTPAVSLSVQLALCLSAVWVLGSFRALAETFVFTMWIFYGLAAFAVFLLRARRPEAARPFRCPGYPVVPALFVLASAAMTALSIYADWKTTGMWLAVLAAGFPVFLVWDRLRKRGIAQAGA